MAEIAGEGGRAASFAGLSIRLDSSKGGSHWGMLTMEITSALHLRKTFLQQVVKKGKSGHCTVQRHSN